MLTPKQCKSLVHVIRDNLKWDMIDEADKLVDDPVKFEKYFRRYNSKLVCDLIFDKPDPLLIGIRDSWIEVIVEWSFKNK